MEQKIEKILKDVLPTDSKISVVRKPDILGDGEYIKIAFCPNAETINNVRGQYPQMVALHLDLNTMELQPQIYGGSGGKCIYRKPDENHSMLAMQRIVIPFRKPKREEKHVLNAIKKFAERWVQALKENKDVLMHKDLVDYDKYLNS